MTRTIDELMLMTRDEVCNLAAGIEETLAELEAGTAARLEALTALENIRRVMLLKGLFF